MAPSIIQLGPLFVETSGPAQPLVMGDLCIGNRMGQNGRQLPRRTVLRDWGTCKGDGIKTMHREKHFFGATD